MFKLNSSLSLDFNVLHDPRRHPTTLTTTTRTHSNHFDVLSLTAQPTGSSDPRSPQPGRTYQQKHSSKTFRFETRTQQIYVPIMNVIG